MSIIFILLFLQINAPNNTPETNTLQSEIYKPGIYKYLKSLKEFTKNLDTCSTFSTKEKEELNIIFSKSPLETLSELYKKGILKKFHDYLIASNTTVYFLSIYSKKISGYENIQDSIQDFLEITSQDPSILYIKSQFEFFQEWHSVIFENKQPDIILSESKKILTNITNITKSIDLTFNISLPEMEKNIAIIQEILEETDNEKLKAKTLTFLNEMKNTNQNISKQAMWENFKKEIESFTNTRLLTQKEIEDIFSKDIFEALSILHSKNILKKFHQYCIERFVQ